MTRKEVIEGNKLIAEFMGYSVGFPHKTDKYGYIQTVEGYIIPSIVNPSPHPSDIDTHQFSLTDLRFHSSWDWLMPCIEKIELIEDSYHGRFVVYISSNNCTIQSTNFRLDKISVEPSHYFNSLYGNSKIEAVWVAIVEFIKWYNSCKKE